MANQVIIWSVIAGYIVVYLLISFFARKYNKSFAVFATAHKMLHPWMVGMATAATLASANLYIGVPGWAYKYGYPVFWWILSCTVTISLGLIVFTRKFFLFYKKKNFGIYTLPHWLGSFYGSKVLQFGVAILTLFNVYYIAGQNIGLATIFEQLNKVPYKVGVMMGVSIVVTYSIFGGRYAGVLTDAIQLIFKSLTGLIILGSIFLIFGANAPTAIHQGLKNQDPALVSILSKEGIFSDWVSIFAIQWQHFTFILLPHLGSLVLSLNDEKDIKPFLISSCVGFFFASSFMWLGGLAARVLYPDLQHADSAMAVYVLNNFSAIMSGIILGGIMSAVLSTADSLYIGISTIITNDILRIPEKRKVLVSRVAIVFIGLLSMLISFNRPKSLTLLTQFGISAIISGITVLIGYAYFGRRKLPPAIAVSIFIIGAGTYLGFLGFGIINNVFKALLAATGISYLWLLFYLRFIHEKQQ
jgi:sodium/pantothenate symporter